MVQLAIELFLLVIAATFCGFAAGYLSAKLRYSLAGSVSVQTDEALEDAPELVDTLFDAEPAVARRIPDPAPPSVSRRKRRISS